MEQEQAPAEAKEELSQFLSPLMVFAYSYANAPLFYGTTRNQQFAVMILLIWRSLS